MSAKDTGSARKRGRPKKVTTAPGYNVSSSSNGRVQQCEVTPADGVEARAKGVPTAPTDVANKAQGDIITPSRPVRNRKKKTYDDFFIFDKAGGKAVSGKREENVAASEVDKTLRASKESAAKSPLSTPVGDLVDGSNETRLEQTVSSHIKCSQASAGIVTSPAKGEDVQCDVEVKATLTASSSDVPATVGKKRGRKKKTELNSNDCNSDLPSASSLNCYMGRVNAAESVPGTGKDSTMQGSGSTVDGLNDLAMDSAVRVGVMANSGSGRLRNSGSQRKGRKAGKTLDDSDSKKDSSFSKDVTRGSCVRRSDRARVKKRYVEYDESGSEGSETSSSESSASDDTSFPPAKRARLDVEDDTPKTSRKRGRPRKNNSVSKVSNVIEIPEDVKETSPLKRKRGRPRKDNSEVKVKVSDVADASSAPDKLGTQRKDVFDASISGVEEDSVLIEGESPAPRKRGRPKKDNSGSSAKQAKADDERPVPRKRGPGRWKKVLDTDDEASDDDEDTGEVIQCKLCDLQTSIKRVLKRHMMAKHALVWSKKNPEGIDNPLFIIRHLKYIECNKCSKRFRFPHYYRHHQMWCGREEEMSDCVECGKTMRSMWMQAHVQAHRTAERKMVVEEEKKKEMEERKKEEEEEE
ncbi:ABC transporter F family member 4, partial [Aplysia californica]|uniref:ABC transporter F family member 4 n=1 Tax=Aplysia californica TaxID=6500 RepID=A0ABM1A165_APLCA